MVTCDACDTKKPSTHFVQLHMMCAIHPLFHSTTPVHPRESAYTVIHISTIQVQTSLPTEELRSGNHKYLTAHYD